MVSAEACRRLQLKHKKLPVDIKTARGYLTMLFCKVFSSRVDPHGVDQHHDSDDHEDESGCSCCACTLRHILAEAALTLHWCFKRHMDIHTWIILHI